MKTLIKILSIALILPGFHGCKKSEENNATDPIVYIDDIHDFYTQNGAPLQTFTLPVQSGGTITGINGGTIYFPQNSLVTLNNQPVTGDVTIQLREVYDRKTMALSNVQTMSGNDLLNSGGMIELRASQGSQQLKFGPGMYADVNIPSNGQGSMQLFYGNFANNQINWTQLPNGGSVNDTFGIYNFAVDSLTWINCDYFYSDPNPKTNIQAMLPAGFNLQNTSVFVSFNGMNALSKMYKFTNGVAEIDPYQIPTGMNVVIGAIGVKGKKHYSCFIPAVITPNLSVTLNMAITTEAQIKTDLSNLP